MADRVPAGSTPIVAGSVSESWARVLRLFHPLPPLNPGLHPTAFVTDGARVDPSSEIGPFAFIGDGVEIGARCRIGAHATIEAGVVIGEDCRIGAGAVISHALIGAGVYVHPGVRVGQDGFGLTQTAEGLISIPQIGRVVIGDNVEIGANSTIDRGALGDTVIGAGSRLDNLVHIGHNVKIGRCCVIVAQVGIAGSTTLEDFVQVGGQAAIAGHLTIGTGAQICGKAGVISDLDPKVVVFGIPAQPKTQYFRQLAWVRRMAGAARIRPGRTDDA
jgi:UDP-3-O-[3-hydroxymyristoyl] glucosamine N-acyltransferase